MPVTTRNIFDRPSILIFRRKLRSQSLVLCRVVLYRVVSTTLSLCPYFAPYFSHFCRALVISTLTCNWYNNSKITDVPWLAVLGYLLFIPYRVYYIVNIFVYKTAEPLHIPPKTVAARSLVGVIPVFWITSKSSIDTIYFHFKPVVGIDNRLEDTWQLSQPSYSKQRTAIMQEQFTKTPQLEQLIFLCRPCTTFPTQTDCPLQGRNVDASTPFIPQKGVASKNVALLRLKSGLAAQCLYGC